MKHAVLLIVLFCATGVSVSAQDAYPRAELFGGYSHFRADPIRLDSPDARKGANGFGVSFAGNLNSKIGLVAELSAHHGSLDVFQLERDWNTYTFLFGPRFSARGSTVTGFGHVLLGGVQSNIENFQRGTHFALAFGGGLDVKASRMVAVRIVQADYIVERHRFEGWFGDFRLQSGIVVRFGNR